MVMRNGSLKKELGEGERMKEGERGRKRPKMPPLGRGSWLTSDSRQLVMKWTQLHDTLNILTSFDR